MKFLNLSFILCLVLALSSCGDDDACTQSDWIGTYIGTIDCDGTSENVTVKITASGSDKIVVTYETVTVETVYDPFAFEECEFNASASAGGTSLTVDATLDGDNLTLSEVIDFSGAVSSCNISATRQ